MRLVRNLTSWLLVGVFTVFLAVGVEMVSHKTFSHATQTTSAISVTPGATSVTNAATTATVGPATLQSTPPITITRTYHGDDSSSSYSSSVQGAYQDN
jgi:hypothetical protein